MEVVGQRLHPRSLSSHEGADCGSPACQDPIGRDRLRNRLATSPSDDL
jgi:hypothetical protein